MKKWMIVLSLGISCMSLYSGKNEDLVQSIARGKEIYMENCVTCHMGNGEGVEGTFPPLAKADFVQRDSTDTVVRVIRYGFQGKMKVNGIMYDAMMPEIGLDSVEIADVTNYIKNSWGNSSRIKYTTPAMVGRVKP